VARQGELWQQRLVEARTQLACVTIEQPSALRANRDCDDDAGNRAIERTKSHCELACVLLCKNPPRPRSDVAFRVHGAQAFEPFLVGRHCDHGVSGANELVDDVVTDCPGGTNNDNRCPDCPAGGTNCPASGMIGRSLCGFFRNTLIGHIIVTVG
jgi:hypothetical protein